LNKSRKQNSEVYTRFRKDAIAVKSKSIFFCGKEMMPLNV